MNFLSLMIKKSYGTHFWPLFSPLFVISISSIHLVWTNFYVNSYFTIALYLFYAFDFAGTKFKKLEVKKIPTIFITLPENLVIVDRSKR